eukprot:CAMPEP_0117031940 /NCGR_PEP_ID=MMETSP0472-20121206/22921_1 /TAXON_ID=693140 ORGANISM="Tiarina fusus, Strain LIS" /NCGR_SAMPLE_ID=MMETSP0472 /ASSEMBLY_ACC=CAM_ASM_000603 /LENGTH=123 /DNA_ID=CAMNT_0004740413 /DNA_START=16 /DNA_END=387 /DNA_ORIENTATION=+
MEAVTFMLTLTMKEDAKESEVRSTITKLAAFVEKKPGACFYQCFQRETGKIEFIETFRNSDSATAHLWNQDEELLQQWFELIELSSCTVIGPASDSLKKALDSFSTASPVAYVDTWAGFGPRN